MQTINLHTTVTRTPDLGGWQFYVESGNVFDADVYAEAYGLNRPDLDPDDVHAAQDRAAQLLDGEWLLVEHELPSQCGGRCRE